MSHTPDPEVGKIREDIERTRRELGDTAEALAHKVDVPARAKEKATEVKETVKAKAEQTLDVARAKTAEVSEQLDQSIDNLPEPTAQRVRGIMVAVRKRPAVFVAGAVLSITIVRRLARRKDRS